MNTQLTDLKVGTLLLGKVTGTVWRKCFEDPQSEWAGHSAQSWRTEGESYGRWGGSGTISPEEYDILEAEFHAGKVTIIWQPAN